MTRGVSWSLCLALVLAGPSLGTPAWAQDGEDEPAADDASEYYDIVETAVTPEQLAEMAAGIGPMGILADGMPRESYTLPSGATVPAVIGAQPLQYKPMAPLPMPDNPGLLDELASGGVHTDGYNSSTSPLPGPRGINPLTTAVSVSEDDTRACTPLLRDHDGYVSSLCISLFNQSELVLFDPSDHFKILAQTSIPKRSNL